MSTLLDREKKKSSNPVRAVRSCCTHGNRAIPTGSAIGTSLRQDGPHQNSGIVDFGPSRPSQHQSGNQPSALSSQLAVPVKAHALQVSVLESTTQSMLPGDLLAVLHDMPLVSEHFRWVQCPQLLHVARPFRCNGLYSRHQPRA